MSFRVCSVSSSKASMFAPEAFGCLLGVTGLGFAIMVFCELLLAFCVCFLPGSVLLFGGLGSFSTGEAIGVATFGVGISAGKSSIKSYSSLGSIFLSDSRFSVFSSM